MYINVHTHTKNLRAFHIQCPDFGNLFEKKKNYNQYIFLLFALLVNAILQNQRKKSTSTGTTRFTKKKNDGLGGDSLTVTVFSLHFL
jgi:hypothetical protein